MHAHRTARRAVLGLLLASTMGAIALPALAQDAGYQAAIANPARTDEDRKADAKRKPAEFLAFAKVRPGMNVLDVSAGGGATSALLAAAVGPSGKVYAQSPKPSPKLDARAAAMPNLKPVLAPFDNPVPAGTPPLDLVTINMSYHDIVNTPTDRAAMNRSLYQALKPGGMLVIVDNAAKPGAGISATNTLHRIEDAAVIAEVSKAGFALDGSSDYLAVPGDPRDQPFFKMEGKPDAKFALRFVKK
jgi:predicted methyltransferase